MGSILFIYINHSIGAVGVPGEEGYGVVSLESACSHLGLQGVPDPLDLVMYECTETQECTVVVKLVWRSVLTYKGTSSEKHPTESSRFMDVQLVHLSKGCRVHRVAID